MKFKVIKLFGREVLRIENHYEATVSDVVRAMIQNREGGDEIEYVCECSCGEDEDDDEEEERFRSRFVDMTERIVWDARTEDHPPVPPFFDNPKDDEDES